MKRFCSLLIALLSLSVWAVGHECWLQPNKYFYYIREIATISFRVGEHFTGENWNGNASRIQQLVHYTPDGKQVGIENRLSATPGDSLRLPLHQEGTHMVIFQSTNSFLEQEPGAFQDYLMEDGLAWVDHYRQTHQETNLNGKEWYQRNVKTLIQVGNSFQGSSTVATNLPLDIIPLENPYQPPGRAPQQIPKVRFKVLFKGKVLNNQMVRIWYKDSAGNTQMKIERSNKRGIVETERHTGPNMVSTVYMERLQNDSKAQWQSYWGSLTFEYSNF